MSTFRALEHRKRPGQSIIAMILYLLGAAALIGADQLVKLWAMDYLKKAGSIDIIGNFLKFTYCENIGAAFSMLEGQRILLIAIPGLVSVLCIGVIISRRIQSVAINIALSLIIAGGIGNLIDRAARHYVVDYINFSSIHFAVFNIADMCVTIGAALFIIALLLNESSSKRRKPRGGFHRY